MTVARLDDLYWPEHGDVYYHFDRLGIYRTVYYDTISIDRTARDLGMVFRTRQDAYDAFNRARYGTAGCRCSSPTAPIDTENSAQE